MQQSRHKPNRKHVKFHRQSKQSDTNTIQANRLHHIRQSPHHHRVLHPSQRKHHSTPTLDQDQDQQSTINSLANHDDDNNHNNNNDNNSCDNNTGSSNNFKIPQHNPTTTTTETIIYSINGQPKAKLSERDKMTMGMEFNVRDPTLSKARTHCKTLSIKFNQLPIPFSKEDKKVYNTILRELLPKSHKSAYIIGPITLDYGFNVHIGENTFINSNCTLLDVAPIKIGKNVMIGPNVDIYTATHSIDYMKRREGYTIGKEVIIEDDVWIGGRAIILPNVTIGARAVIGAGSVVTTDVLPDTFVAGNPAVFKKKLLNEIERQEVQV